MQDEQKYVVDSIGAFLSGSDGEWDWDGFTSCPLRGAKLDSVRRRAGAVDLPLDAEGEAILKELLVEVELLTGDDLTKPKPWRVRTGIIGGLIVGALLWWGSYVPGAGPLQNPKLILLPTGLGFLIVTFRNKRKRVGPYDPEILALNKQGRV